MSHFLLNRLESGKSVSTIQMIFKTSPATSPGPTYPPHLNLTCDLFVYSSNNRCLGGRSVIADVYNSEGSYWPSLN